MPVETLGSPAMWGGFLVFVVAMLALDLGVFHRKAHSVSIKEAAIWSVVWITMAMVFNGWLVWKYRAEVSPEFGYKIGLEFLTGYLIEKALSVDNIFVFLVIFKFFAVPANLQHRVLFWGIIGALIMRAIFIAVGAALLAKFHWVMYVFGALQVFTGIKLLTSSDEHMDPSKSYVYRTFKRLVPITPDYRGPAFTVIENGKRLATPLALVLVIIEATDLVFAIDSIPAIFAVTQDPFIVFTSNIFAIFGLRSLFFLLAGVMDKFHYLKVGLALVLGFVGMKMLVVDYYKVPTPVSLIVVATLIAGSILISWLVPPKKLAEESAALPPSVDPHA